MCIPQNFQGFVYEPDNEQETIALFMRVMNLVRPSWCIKRLQAKFPDGIFHDTEKAADIRAEFEYLSSHFLAHEHDPKGCDLIICWENDLAPSVTENLDVPILTLKHELAHAAHGHLCLGWKRENSLDASLDTLLASGERGASAVARFAKEELPKLQARHPGLFWDRSLSAHYKLRLNGKGLLGVYPNGRLVFVSIEQFCQQFGEGCRTAARQFYETARYQALSLNLSPKSPDSELEERLRVLVNALDELCSRLTELEQRKENE